MAIRTWPASHPLAVELWSKTISNEILPALKISSYMGEGEESLIQIKTELGKDAGDRITFGLTRLLTGDGVVGDAELEGKEESTVTYNDQVVINQLRHAVDIGGVMDAERVTDSVRNSGKIQLRRWASNRMETIIFNHLCGYTAETRPQYIGANTITAPTTGRHLWEGSATTDEGLGTTQCMTLTLLDRAVEVAKTNAPLISPASNLPGSAKWVCFVHPYQAKDLRTNTATGQWLDIQKAVLAGGKGDSSPIMTGALGVYNDVLLVESNYITEGVHSTAGTSVTTARRAILCGAQAAVIGFGKASKKSARWFWKEKMFDYDNVLKCATGSIFGVKKTRFRGPEEATTTSIDYGVLTLSTYAAAGAN